MTFFQIEIEINASAELVWATMRDVERWSESTPTGNSETSAIARKVTVALPG
jgi:hypothetical protein